MPEAQVSQELAQHCREHLVAVAVPSRVHCVPQLPRSSAGKLQRSRLKDLLPTPQRPSLHAEAAAAGANLGYSLQPAPRIAPANVPGVSITLLGSEAILTAGRAGRPQSSSLASEAALTGLSGPGSEPVSEASVMQAFQAALGGAFHGLEPVTDFWAAGGDSRAAMQVQMMPGCLQIP